MSQGDEDDKPTVVLDLNALKKRELKQEEDLANIASELEFNVGKDEASRKIISPKTEEIDNEDFAQNFLDQRQKSESVRPAATQKFRVILFDFQSDFFQKSKGQFPLGFNYHIAKTLPELNDFLKSKEFQIVVFNYDVNPKAVNQLTAQIKLKKPTTKSIIMARAISPEKAKLHAKTASGATGYYQYPLDASKVEKEFQKIAAAVKKVS